MSVLDGSAQDAAGLDLRRGLVFVRAWLRQGGRRVRGAVVPVLQAAVGASAAWLIAERLLNQPAPIFAPIACWICLGFTRNRVPRKVAELALGATMGVGLGELFATWVGAGWWQIGLVLIVGALIGRFLDRGDMVAIQSAVNGIVIVGMSAYATAMPGGSGFRWTDALLGGLVAFVIAVAVPRRVAERPRRYARSALDETAETIQMLGYGLRAGDIEAIRDVKGQLRALSQLVDDWGSAIKAASDIAALNPTLRSERPRIEELDRLHRLNRRTLATLTMLTRMSVGLSEHAGAVPDVAEMLIEASTATRGIADAVGTWTRPTEARRVLEDVAAASGPGEIVSEDWRPATLMSLMRVLVVDLLQLSGLSHEDARARLADMGVPFPPDADSIPPEDEASSLWG